MKKRIVFLLSVGFAFAQSENPNGYGIAVGTLEADPVGTELVRHMDGKNLSIVRSVYGHLDMSAGARKLVQEKGEDAPVPLGPILVVGEGESPMNHTVIRILDRYQLPEQQFLAFPPEVKGGVGVEAVAAGDGKRDFVAWPLTDAQVKTVRRFNRHGALVGEWSIPSGLRPPYVVAGGDFVKENPGDEIAVTSRHQKGNVMILSSRGEVLATVPSPETDGEAVNLHLATVSDRGRPSLLWQNLRQGRAFVSAEGGRTWARVNHGALPGTARLFGGVFTDFRFLAGGAEPLVSTLYAVGGDGKVSPRDIGLRENSFSYLLSRTHGSWTSEWPRLPDTKYIREYSSLGTFMMAQNWSPLAQSGEIRNRTGQEWLQGLDFETMSFLRADFRKNVLPWDQYASNEGPRTVSVYFSHRWDMDKVKALIEKKGPDGLPLYLMLGRTNLDQSGGYFGKVLFNYGSYNYEQPELSDFYFAAQRAFFRRFAKAYRTNPSLVQFVKPSHENEIVSGRGSLGDYNPANIRGFYRYLLALCGTRENIDRMYGLDFQAGRFDAPRNLNRGPWDAYGKDNLFFRDWVEYHRILVYRRVGEALLGVVTAGIPPQLTRTHQIPDYAVGGTIGIADNVSRITPVDWFLTAGTGFGFTRYGLWYENEPDMALSSHSSGFDDVFIGEYASKVKTADADKAFAQLEYAARHGIKGAMIMSWPDEGLKNGYNETQYEALKRLHETHGNTPLPGLAGGISQVRGFHGHGKPYAIAAMGATESNTGLLKSIDAQGRMEGTVYVSPFHAHVEVENLLFQESASLSGSATVLCGPLSVRQGALIEVTFEIPPEGKAHAVEIRMEHRGIPLPAQTTAIPNLVPGGKVRVVYKFPVILERVSLSLVSKEGSQTVRNLRVVRHQDMAANLSLGLKTGERHRGGVRFDVLGE